MTFLRFGDAPVSLAIDSTFFIYRNPECQVPWAENSNAWAGFAARCKRDHGIDISNAMAPVCQVDGEDQLGPIGMLPYLKLMGLDIDASKLVRTGESPATIPALCQDVFVQERQTSDLVVLTAYPGLTRLNLFVQPIPIQSYGYALAASDPKLVRSITYVFPTWLRSFCPNATHPFADSAIQELPENHVPIRGVWFDSFNASLEGRALSGAVMVRNGALNPPWCDRYFADQIQSIRAPVRAYRRSNPCPRAWAPEWIDSKGFAYPDPVFPPKRFVPDPPSLLVRNETGVFCPARHTFLTKEH